MVYRGLFRLGLTRVDAERAHHLGFAALRTANQVPGAIRLAAGRSVPASPVQALGLSFPGPLGLAAGFDKNARGIDALAAIGFDFVEVGTVTARPQPGNPRPRLFRLVDDRAVVNRMGFNNDGAEVVAERLRDWHAGHADDASRPIVGVNIGRSKLAGDDEAVADYETSARLLAPSADYLVVNVSSPNTPGLRDLQAVDRLAPLLEAVRSAADASAGRHVPLLVKIAPDLADDDVVALVAMAERICLDGLVAVNTTVARTALLTRPDRVAAAGAGGLSGAPLRERSWQVLRLVRDAAPGLTVISVGGISDGVDVRARLAAGASLVQAYTAFVYGGPRWPRDMHRRIGDSVGTDARGASVDR